MKEVEKKEDKQASERMKKAAVLDSLSEVYHRYVKGVADEEELRIIEEVTPIILDGTGKKKLDADEVRCAGQEVLDELATKLPFRSVSLERKAITKKIHRSNYFLRYTAVAATIALLVGMGYFTYEFVSNADVQQMPHLTEYADGGIRKAIRTADGSLININLGTSIKIPTEEFNKEKREVWMAHGEAFFDVAKNPQKPFIIHAGEVNIQVKGTSFNVKNYPELSQCVVSVCSGRVEIGCEDKLLTVLTVNNELIYDTNTGRYEVVQKDCSAVKGWTQGDLVLNNAEITELCLRLKQVYGVDVEAKAGVMQEVKLNATYAAGTKIEKVLESLHLLYGVKYSITGHRVVLSADE